ncbi:PQQ-dependent dehydrogenase, methanol/ethanol family [Ideonella sp. 4Y16]|uniref:PQQ-dependent dehydrogenase, methanol/ethanol family n=1 Tax=Ideonella alba TaxID=2824118 RepID=A0A940YF31_9BURK|nr:PQQ-dependent dehydrogenase, methanol/ethanol family [Ideonella alba]MBQ0932066.1 PQQ-dependent dehydrogenase, methanol/ethanol family [Ideonella alba]MBQ0945652.1 PQQ-dependent dehydrogenase, methanol/ethanol family [Ideonella alba]
MNPTLRPLTAALIALTLATPAAFALGPYAPVTDARLANPEPANWLQYRGNYGGWGYSPLEQIHTGNVGKLKLAWSLATGQTEGHQSPPIVNNGYMFVTTPGAQVIALDAASGAELWRWKKELPGDLMQLHPTNRGVALYGDKVYVATVDAQLVALDAKTGKQVWAAQVGDTKALQYITLAPLAAKGKIMVGSSGGETGVRGFVAAFDAATGKEAWRTFTTAAPGEPGGDTWPGDTHKNGGGSIWITGSYDAATNLAYWGTGNPAPWPTEGRKGDNLYTTSAIALDVDTGAIKGHHQYHHNDAWDWDEVSAPVLIDTEVKGRKVKAAIHAGRNGYLWMLERKEGGKIGFIDAQPYVYNNVFTGIDKTTGRPSYDESKRPGMGKAVGFCPSLWGGKDWPPEAWNPKTGLFYIPANNNLCAELPAAEPGKYKKGDLYIGYPIEGVLGSLRYKDGQKPSTIGELQAWDLKTGKQVWVHKFDTHLWAPLLTTGGKLVFAGGTNDRQFRAFDASNGQLLWQYAMPSGVTAVPTSFEVNGEQFIAVQAGWGVDAQRMQSGIDSLTGKPQAVPQGGTVMVFKLEK